MHAVPHSAKDYLSTSFQALWEGRKSSSSTTLMQWWHPRQVQHHVQNCCCNSWGCTPWGGCNQEPHHLFDVGKCFGNGAHGWWSKEASWLMLAHLKANLSQVNYLSWSLCHILLTRCCRMVVQVFHVLASNLVGGDEDRWKVYAPPVNSSFAKLQCCLYVPGNACQVKLTRRKWIMYMYFAHKHNSWHGARKSNNRAYALNINRFHIELVTCYCPPRTVSAWVQHGFRSGVLIPGTT